MKRKGRTIVGETTYAVLDIHVE